MYTSPSDRFTGGCGFGSGGQTGCRPDRAWWLWSSTTIDQPSGVLLDVVYIEFNSPEQLL